MSEKPSSSSVGIKLAVGKEIDDYQYEQEECEEVEEEEFYDIKHKPGTQLARELIEEFQPQPVQYGYRRRLKDGLFKIQGSKSLEDRAKCSLDEIKPCYITSAIAIIYAVLRPLHEWSAQRIDRVINDGKEIASRVSNFKSADNRMITNITVDDYKLNVVTISFDKTETKCLSANKRFEKIVKERHYIMIQYSNCTFAVYHDKFYHLFDPYASMDLLVASEEEEEEEETYGRSFEQPERNTASWILFANVNAMLEYINKRVIMSDAFKFHVVYIANYKKAPAKLRMLQLLTDFSVHTECKVPEYGEDESTVCAHNETATWLKNENNLPIWSRLNRRNAAGKYRNTPVTKLKKFDVEIDGRLWSLWGNLHPLAPCFDSDSRGKQYLACNVIACCAAKIYRLADWSSQLLDNIIVSGDKYHCESLANIKQLDFEFSLEHLNLDCELQNIKFAVHLEHVAFGRLYCVPTATKMNLAEGLMYFFSHFPFGILQVRSRSLAIGHTLGYDGGYFMFDCQSQEHPLFPKDQGAAYVLRTRHLQILLYCIVMALRIPYYNIQYTLHKVEMLREGAPLEGDFMEEEEEEA